MVYIYAFDVAYEMTRQPVRELLLSNQHACLPTPVALPAEVHTPGHTLPHRRNGVPQPLAIACRITWPGRAERALLAERQIAAQYGETRASKGFCHCDKQRHLRIAARSMSENQAIA